ncbi:CGNR zinc finger domain-containing protein [Microlunatus parietis]|uniref:Putative RNA-binding Zn ribbon-like protein n=1 Tax=Microlunatus parietis TaxID=682979 RepID=A0A7Y9I6S1_9ACTN|nr:CGNR zinc finger domain-containing protein [Microlunatus parietis]NYE71285.1 putative RNA-binding Zn ribbon-like protein [Microlunatus parietis]
MKTVTRWTDDHFIAGDLALDFANTVYRRLPEVGADLLDSGAALIGWYVHAGLLRPAEGDARRVTAGQLAAARLLRARLWAVLEAQRVGNELPSGALAGLLASAQAGLERDLVVAADGAVTPRTAAGAGAAVALRAVRLVLNPPARPVRSCDRCGWYFLDTSRGRRRRWCSMKTCGNQAKAARFRETHA